MNTAAPAPDEAEDVRPLQQALLRELRNGHSLAFGLYEGRPLLYHDGHTFVYAGRTGHGAEFYEVLRTEADVLALLGGAVADAQAPAWPGQKVSAADPWREMLGRVVPGRPAPPWDAAWRRLTPVQHTLAIMAAAVGVLVAIGTTVYLLERHAQPVQPHAYVPPGASR